MTLRVDVRAGSVELLAPLQAAGVPVEAATLPYGDLAFEGRGPGGRSVSVGIEFKRLPDLLACITDGRFAGHQLPGMQDTYEVSYLYVEGAYRTGYDERLEWNQGKNLWARYPHGSWTYSSIENWLTTINVKGGMQVRKTSTRDESIESIIALYRWWTYHDFDTHRAHMATHDKFVGRRGKKLSPLVRMLMAGVEGLGEARAVAIAAHYKSVQDLLFQDLLMCSEKGSAALMSVPGIGKVLAKRILQVMRGEKEA